MMKVTHTFITLFLTCVLVQNVTAQVKTVDKTITLKGLVVAENIEFFFHACYHVCGATLLVKPDKSDGDQFVIVNVEYMDDRSKPRNGFPAELVQQSARWEFKAVSEDPILLRQFTKFTENGKDVSELVRRPAWSLLKGSENEKLPFGATIQVYGVRPGKYKFLK